MITIFIILLLSFLLGFLLGNMPRIINRKRKKKGFRGDSYSGDMKKWDARMLQEYKEEEKNPYMQEDMDFWANKNYH